MFQDWDRESTPLKPKGGDAKFLPKQLEKFSGEEGENIFVQLEVEGDPVPKIEWFKGFKDLSMEGGRFKSWTNGAMNQVVLGIENIKQEDEGAYKCVLNGTVEHEFSVYVTGKTHLSIS